VQQRMPAPIIPQIGKSQTVATKSQSVETKSKCDKEKSDCGASKSDWGNERQTDRGKSDWGDSQNWASKVRLEQ
jgi:hypothetical protein